MAVAISTGGVISTQYSSSSSVANKNTTRTTTTTTCFLKTVFNNTRISTSGGRKRIDSSVVSPKVSDSMNSQTACSLDPDVSRSVLGIIIGGGSNTQLPHLPMKDWWPIPFAPNYRLIDILVSNCMNSNISNIYVLTQSYCPLLARHVPRVHASHMGGHKNEGFAEILLAEHHPAKPNLFWGTADAVRQYSWLFEKHDVKEYLILAGDYLHHMDYEKCIQAHRETDADITIAALPVDEIRAVLGVLKIDEEGRIIEFAERPKGVQLKSMKVDTTILGLDDERAKEMPYVASMGIYVVSKDVMLNLLRDKFPRANEFEGEVIPGAISLGMKVQAYLYDGYWEDIGTGENSDIRREIVEKRRNRTGTRVLVKWEGVEEPTWEDADDIVLRYREWDY